MEFVQEEGVCAGRGSPSSETANLFPAESRSVVLEVEREHMFDKVVTPSDVGKLNRLVIPKQHAERYFPLEQSNKGLLLNFEDRHGKPWRFRYSYWNSSQSYVMTKGWSRFVKDKRLDAGDIVSFHRLAGGDRLFIDWRRRPPPPPSWGALYHLGPRPPVYYLRPSFMQRQTNNTTATTHVAAGKRLRLFGVNMEQSSSCDHHQINNITAAAATNYDHQPDHYHVSSSEKGKSSLSFDLDL